MSNWSNFNLDAPAFVPRFAQSFQTPSPSVVPPSDQPIQSSITVNQAPPTITVPTVSDTTPKPEPTKIVDSTDNVAKPKENVEDVTSKLENLETADDWDTTAGTTEDGTTDGSSDAAAKKKKNIVVREFKPKKEPVNIIFCGHVDAGKSTIGGQLMFLTGMVDKRTLEKYEREAKDMNRESWYLSWALDTNNEEREKGITVEVGRAFFETEKKHFTILDAPGHRGFVRNMIGGAAQADIAVLVISARKGEFETGFERGGQTREHAMLVKTAGVKYLIVLINKMDDTTVQWDKARYDEIVDKLAPFLKKCGFQPGKDTYFMPCSGFTGAFIKDPPEESVCDWFKGPSFINYLDELSAFNRSMNGPVRMPIIDRYKDMGTVILGKIESGTIRLGDKLCIMPNKAKVEVTNIYLEDEETDSAICGENVKLKIKGVEDTDISNGFILCDMKDICHVAKVFDAQISVLECPSIISAGFNSIMHIHTATVEVQLKAIIGLIDKKTGEKDLKNRPRFIKQDQIAICRFDIQGGNICCMEPFKSHAQLGRFTLRYEDKTIAIGKVLKIIE